jgi:hypothetical protein
MFFRILLSCFPPTKAKRKRHKQEMMTQRYIESDPSLAYKYIDVQYDLLEMLNITPHDDRNLDLLALRFKHWYTRAWDSGEGEELPEKEKQRIRKVIEKY